MKVHVRDKTDDKQQATVGEMAPVSGEIGYVFEMVTDPAKLDDLVPVAGIAEKAAQIAANAEDDKPEFPVVRVEEGWSGSDRLWPGTELVSIVKQTNELEPVGHLGHIPPDQASTAFPDVQTTWLGAVIKDEPSQQKDRVGEMVKVAYFAGYNHVGAKVRKLLRTRAVRGISWWGRAHSKPIPGRGVEMSGFELQALDWARKGSEGMPTSRVVAIASEMEDRSMELELAQVTPAQFKEQNPNGYALLVSEAQTEMKEQVGEMETKLEDAKKKETVLDSVMQLLGVDDPDKLIEQITALKTKVGDKAKGMVSDALDKLLTEKVPDEEKRALVRRLVPVGEMETAAEDADDAEAVAKIVGEMTDKAFNDDDMLKQIVSEQAAPVVRRAEEVRTATGKVDNEYTKGRTRVPVGG